MADETSTTGTESSQESTTATTETASTEAANVTTGGDTSTDTGASDDTTLLGSSTADTGTGDDKGADGKVVEGKAEPKSDTESGIPGSYELKPFKVGEGESAATIEIDSTLLETVTPGLKEAGITQAQLDKLAPVVPAIQEAALKQLNDGFSKTRADWSKQATEDPEIGGAKLDETKLLAAKALDHFGARSEIKDGKETNEFRVLLNESGLGNHPVMLKIFRNVGAAISEDANLVRNTQETSARKSREEINYPNDVPKS